MLSATFCRKLLLALMLLAGSAVIAFSGYRMRDAVLFARLSESEKKLVGVWTWTTIDAVGRMRIRPNHRFDMWFIESKHDEDHPDRRYAMHGRWRIEGAEFIYVYNPGQLSGGLPTEEQRGRLTDFGKSITKVSSR